MKYSIGVAIVLFMIVSQGSCFDIMGISQHKWPTHLEVHNGKIRLL
jgi:hypothetical protein